MIRPESSRRSFLAVAWLPAALLPACIPQPTPPAAPIVVVAVATGEASAADEGYRCEGTPLRAGSQDYCAYSNPVPWATARQACTDTGAQLASFGTETEARALFEAAGPPIGAAESLWFGLAEPQGLDWSWVDGTPLAYAHWNKGEPNNDGGVEDCAEWKVGNGTWNDAPCWARRGFVCERKAGAPGGPACPGEAIKTRLGDYCVQLAKQTWPDASETCAAWGGSLAVISSEAEDTAFFAAVGPRLPVSSVWVGYNDMAREGSWRWVSNERGRFAEWKAGEPNDYGGEDCAEWFPEDGQMNDLPCTTKRPYLCERLPPKVASPP